MKIYIVTFGCYSDYSISKVFTDRAKAEEYKEWLPDANDIEEYETEDDLVVNKYYELYIDFTVFPDGQRGPNVRIQKANHTWGGLCSGQSTVWRRASSLFEENCKCRKLE